MPQQEWLCALSQGAENGDRRMGNAGRGCAGKQTWEEEKAVQAECSSILEDTERPCLGFSAAWMTMPKRHSGAHFNAGQLVGGKFPGSEPCRAKAQLLAVLLGPSEGQSSRTRAFGLSWSRAALPALLHGPAEAGTSVPWSQEGWGAAAAGCSMPGAEHTQRGPVEEHMGVLGSQDPG